MRRLPYFSYPIKFDLGCGQFKREGYVGLDCNDYGQDIVWDACQGLPFPNDSVEAFYSSHFLEHMSWDAIPNLLGEIVRVCKDGTRLECVVPHADTKEAYYICHKIQWSELMVRGIVADCPNLGLVSMSRDGINFRFTLSVMKEGRMRERVTLGQYEDHVEREHVARYLFARKYCRGKLVADIACGTGYGLKILGEVAASVTGYDKHLLCGNVVLDLDSQQWTEQYDVITSFETIEHLIDQDRFLANISRTCKLAIISTPLNEIPGNPFHKHQCTFNEMAARLGNHFGSCEYYFQDGSEEIKLGIPTGTGYCFLIAVCQRK